MTKRRKTRQQKIITELRRKVQSAKESPQLLAHQETPTGSQKYTYTLPSVSTKLASSPTQSYVQSYAYLPSDLRKTAFITCTLIAAQCFLYLLLRMHIVSLPFASY